MGEQELSKLNRKELLTMLLNLTKENEELKARVEELQIEVDSREIRIGSCGSIAEAALELNNVFAKADLAAAQYLENIKAMHDEELKNKLQAESESLFTRQKCMELEENTKQRCAQMEEETAAKCADMVAKATQEADDYQKTVMSKISGLKEEYEKVLSIFSTLQTGMITDKE